MSTWTLKSLESALIYRIHLAEIASKPQATQLKLINNLFRVIYIFIYASDSRVVIRVIRVYSPSGSSKWSNSASFAIQSLISIISLSTYYISSATEWPTRRTIFAKLGRMALNQIILKRQTKTINQNKTRVWRDDGDDVDEPFWI